MVTALAVECYQPVKRRDDEAFYRTFDALKGRSEFAPVWANGVVISDLKDFDRIRRLHDAAAEAAGTLKPLAENPKEVSEADARKAWKKVFRHSFFEQAAKLALAGLEQKSALSSPAALVGPALVGLGEADRFRRAEAAARDLEERAKPLRPWAE